MIHCTWSAIYNGIDGPCSSIFHHAKWPESSAQSNCKTVINNPLLKRFTNFHLSNGLMCDITLRHVAKGKSICKSWFLKRSWDFLFCSERTPHTASASNTHHTPGHSHGILKSDIAHDPRRPNGWYRHHAGIYPPLSSFLGESVGHIPIESNIYHTSLASKGCTVPIAPKNWVQMACPATFLWWPLLLLDASELCTNAPWPL